MVRGNRDDVPGSHERPARARSRFRIEPPPAVPLLTVPQAFTVISHGTVLVSLLELLRRSIAGWL